ncbi:MAG: hypothetical protein A3C02_01705 [Candidatus Andersenbacteria bacterium RIFCSPHIGHO2_02_FULL_45_11]|nr:MAG: hypothetical protein A3C02_01705 [Candidatus Andersenbacteria bacterium RIFCSPHIGHO2_02_FULL_45_11]
MEGVIVDTHMQPITLQFYQIVVVGIALFMIYTGTQKFLSRGAGQSLLKLLVRIVVWGGMAAVALFPEFTDVLAKLIGLEGNINAVILVGFLLVFLMIFKILSVVERIEQDITRTVRRESLDQFQGRKK